MKKIHFSLITLIIVLSGNIAFAGSPLIYTKFFTAYYTNEKVQLAEELEILDGSLATYISDKAVAVDQKIAVLNALQWNEKGKNNVDTYKMLLGRKYGKSFDQLNPDEMSADELLCLGYMISLDRQRKLTDALPILEKAKDKNPASYIAQLIYSLAKAQEFINNNNECRAWKTCDELRNYTTFTQDIEPEAITIIFQAVDTYKNNCK